MVYKINSYYLSNRSKLLIIPSLVVFLLVMVFLFNIGIKFSFFVEAVSSTVVDKALPESYFFQKDISDVLDPKAVNNINLTVQNSTASIKIDSDKCSLVESVPPQEYKKIGQIVVYWKSNDCANLTGIGVVYKPDQQFLSTVYTKYLKKDVFLVQNSNETNWLDKLGNYSNTLTTPLSTKIKSFTTTAKDTYEFEDDTYYLDGVCTLKNLTDCKLWKVNNKSGDFNLIFDNLSPLAESLGKLTQDSIYSLRISGQVVQNSKYYNLLLIKNNLAKTWLITIDSITNNLVTTIDLSNQDKIFVSKYLR